ncbi:mitochondrial 39-S ribosomal protein L47 (MRP-L47)-domain-containing protein [Leucosporidium creatinivorum]|uniref:Large ribosomal subunit protein uL29m n=1 Tax=Leucosporidium creatinivorum TaxID=106004 RepID=A0A1Y2E928_9BASI|nr:mitochondrial 39-S ribosomal protein L47 (MRP-L47)-domain-containing protein [Leucosporidium creatinivorum]
MSFSRLASTSRLPAIQRSLSTSCTSSARAQPRSGLPKRDATLYGLPSDAVPRSQWPNKEQTDTTGHPLWRFFHGQESLEVPDKRKDETGRSWTSLELRRKSFSQLHQLWYILLRERNVLLTQREEARRLRVDLKGFSSQPEKLRMCQKSMARVKQVLAERRLAALQAAQILREKGDVEGAERMENEAKEAGVGEREV